VHDLFNLLMTMVIALSFPLVGGSSAMAFKTDLRKDVAGVGLVEVSSPEQPMAQIAVIAAAGFYVSTAGSDSNDGSFARPFASLAQAQLAMRHSTIKTTYVEGGDYYLHKTVNLTAADNGESFLAYQGQTVTVHGGQLLNGWTQRANGVWTTHVPTGFFDSGANGNLDIGGVLQTAARFPDAVPTNPIQGGWLYATGGSSNSIKFKAGDVPRFSSTAGLYVEVFGQRGWESYLEPVTSIDYTTNTVHLGGSTWDPVGTGSRYFFFNAADQLNAPGEWYYDPVSSTVSYKPSDPNWTGGNAVGANLSQVFAINGASNITLGGLTINGSTNNGVGIDIVNSSNITVEGDHIYGVGTGVHLSGSTQVQIHGSEINNTVGNAIALVNGSNYNTVAGNSIHDIGTLQAYSSGISFFGSSNNDFANNTIANISKFGIAGGSNLGLTDASYNNIIEYNSIDHTNLASSDGGGIMIIGTQQNLTGDIIRYNSVSNVTAAGTTSWDGTAGSTFLDPLSKLVSFGIYLDDFASGIQVYGNVLNHNISGIDIHSGWNNTITNNIVANGTGDSLVMQAPNWTGPGTVASSQNVFDSNIVVANSATSGTSQSGGSLTAASWDHNLYFGTQLSGAPFHIWGTTAPNYANTFAQWQAQGFDLHSLVTDPLFVNAAQGNFALAANSPAYALGFQDIPIGQIGLVGYHAINNYDMFGHIAA
jgi:parallel beta-helix repeat protein